MAKQLPGAVFALPRKKTKKRRLTEGKKAHNHHVNSKRVRVEHTIGRLKGYARLTDTYDGTNAEFEREFCVITGLVNLDLLRDGIRDGAGPPGPNGPPIDWDGAGA